MTAAQTTLIGLSPDALKDALIAAGLPEKGAAMRTKQLWNWVYVHGARDFAAMTNLAKDVRALLADHFTLARPEVVTEQISTDGTRKWLLRTNFCVPVWQKRQFSVQPTWEETHSVPRSGSGM